MFNISNIRDLLFWGSGWLPVGLFSFILYRFNYHMRDTFYSSRRK